ncbi:MAG TPA: FAD-dependent oxidoreductase [Opitutaceae bacterium]
MQSSKPASLASLHAVCRRLLLSTALTAVPVGAGAASTAAPEPEVRQADLVIVGGTPAGIMSAVSAARLGRTALLLERTNHIGGLPANGLGATDGRTGGLFAEFAERILTYYTTNYGADSPQVKDCSFGRHFEPSVAEKVFAEMLAEQPGITVLKLRQFDSHPDHCTFEQRRLTGIRVLNRETGAIEHYAGKVFIDATYEGDLAAAAGAPYRLGREDQREFNEPMAGQAYKYWRGPVAPGTTGRADNAIQAYNYRLPLTKNPALRVPIPKPAKYDRDDYASLIEDVKLRRHAGTEGQERTEMEWEGIGRVVNMVRLPNGKTDANNQHAAFLSTDLPEENWPWPTSGWDWRDRFAERLKNYTLGLLWFVQNDPELPAEFRALCSEWGLAKDEYTDNAHFPRQVYVREGRRILGEYLFTAHDALPVEPDGRPPVHADSITAASYNLDSHAVRKREKDRVNLDGMFSWPAAPYTVPYRVIVPREVEGLLVPVAASSTHIGYSTLRMEPCWMALGQAAGVAASQAIAKGQSLRALDVPMLQEQLLREKAILLNVRDAAPDHPHFAAIQAMGLKGLLPEWHANPDANVTQPEVDAWRLTLGLPTETLNGMMTRGAYLARLWDEFRR